MISSSVLESRLPVGSSARIMSGSLMSDLAMATRCCWPPESSFGLWSRRSSSPTRVASSMARGSFSWSETSW